MPRFNPTKNSFVAGELSPRLEARDDLPQYFQGMRQAKNGVVLPHGGFMRRSGTRFVAAVADSSAAARLIPFQVSTIAAYILEFGPLTIRFFVNEAQLATGGSAVEVTSTYTAAQLPDLQYAQSADVLWLVHPDHHPKKLTRTSSTAFALADVVWRGGAGPLRPQNLTATTITATKPGTPVILTFSVAQVFTAGADVGRIIRHTKGSATAWYKVTAVTSTTILEATLMGGATTVGGGADADWALGLFSNTEGPRAVTFHQGRLCYGGTSTEPDRLVLSAPDDYDSFPLVTDKSLSSAENADNAISRRVTNGKMNAIQFLASAAKKLTIATRGGEFSATSVGEFVAPLDMAILPVAERGAAHAMPVTVGANIVFLERNKRSIRELGQFASPTTGYLEEIPRDIGILAEHILYGGATEMAYQQDPDSIIWVPRADGTLVGFTREADQKVVGAHRHEIGGTYQTGIAVVESVAVIPSPDQDQDQLWLVVKRTVNGATVRHVEFMEDTFRPGLTSASATEAKVRALEPAFFVDSGLSLDAPLTITAVTRANPGVVTAASHGFSNGDRVRIRDVLGMTELNHVSFKVASVATNTFELTTLADVDVNTSAYTVYSAGGKVREEVTAISGLSHLEGETVQVLADGAAHTDEVVSSGAIALTRNASIVHVGLPFITFGESQRFFGGGAAGGDQGRTMRIQSVVVRLHDTVGIEVGVGPGSTDMETILFREGTDNLDESPPLFTGDKHVGVNGGWTTEVTVSFRQTQALPMTVLAVYPRAESGELDE
jgi:hypothetical protein